MSLIIFDLDMTLVDTSVANDARNAGNWREVYNLIPQMKIYEGIKELIDSLKYHGVKYAVVTSSPSSYASRILKYFEIDTSMLIAYHDTEHRKPNPEPINLAIQKFSSDNDVIISIGDHHHDMIASNLAGIVYVGARWGCEDIESLEKSATGLLYNTPLELIEGGLCLPVLTLIEWIEKNLQHDSSFLNPARLSYKSPDYLQYYIPQTYKNYAGNSVQNPYHDSLSKKLLSGKSSQDSYIIEEYSSQLENQIPTEVVITTVPSSDSNNRDTFIKRIAQSIARNQRVDGTECLIRKTSITSSHFNNNRNIMEHLRTITLMDSEMIKNKDVYLLDDVSTTETSLHACFMILKKAGAKSIKTFVLGKTVHYNPEQDIINKMSLLKVPGFGNKAFSNFFISQYLCMSSVDDILCNLEFAHNNKRIQNLPKYEDILDALRYSKKSFKFCLNNEICIIDKWSQLYPLLLRDKDKSPGLLFCKGNCELLKEPFMFSFSNKDAVSMERLNFLASIENLNPILVTEINSHSDFIHGYSGKVIGLLNQGFDINDRTKGIPETTNNSLIEYILNNGGCVVSQFLMENSYRDYCSEKNGKLIKEMAFDSAFLEKINQYILSKT